uniref:Phosphoribosylformylglycinamidine synthase n=1 Tax=Calidris pygmaea TaxID=425635 RepID=A0A8C3KFJ9_9CHAR
MVALGFRSPEGLGAALGEGLVPLRYADDVGRPTETYPLNPNGSKGGVAALCSPCGRHLAIMPHPERGVTPWQWGWWPPAWGRPTARGWCLGAGLAIKDSG